ncbi:MAG: hypothetical protein ACTSU5_17130 [Promethearchaeota archaeon]
MQHYIGFVGTYGYFLNFDSGGRFLFPDSLENYIKNLSRLLGKNKVFVRELLEKFNTDEKYPSFLLKRKKARPYVPTRDPYSHRFCSKDAETILSWEESFAEDAVSKFQKYHPDDASFLTHLLERVKNIKNLIELASIEEVMEEIQKTGAAFSLRRFGISNFLEFLPFIKTLETSFDKAIDRDRFVGRVLSTIWQYPLDFLVFIIHDFSSVRCEPHNALFFHPTLCEKVIHGLEKLGIKSKLVDSIEELKNRFEETHLTPLFDFRDRNYFLLQVVFEHWRYGKPVFTYELESYQDELQALVERKFLVIKEDEVRLKDETQEELNFSYFYESKVKAFFDMVQTREQTRIDRNKRKFVMAWLNSGVVLENGKINVSLPDWVGGDVSEPEPERVKNRKSQEDISLSRELKDKPIVRKQPADDSPERIEVPTPRTVQIEFKCPKKEICQEVFRTMRESLQGILNLRSVFGDPKAEEGNFKFKMAEKYEDPLNREFQVDSFAIFYPSTQKGVAEMVFRGGTHQHGTNINAVFERVRRDVEGMGTVQRVHLFNCLGCGAPIKGKGHYTCPYCRLEMFIPETGK